MKLATLALASVFALTSTVALATTHHKYKSSKTAYSKNYGRYGGSYGQYRGGYGQYGGGGQYYGNPNDRGGLVGGADPGTYKP